MPGVQKPHWSPWQVWKAVCIGCRSPLRASPSMVVTARPSASTASMAQLLTDLPSTQTVQAPHWLVSHPTWVPVRRRCSRSSSTSSVRGSTSTAWLFSLTFSVIVAINLPFPESCPQAAGCETLRILSLGRGRCKTVAVVRRPRARPGPRRPWPWGETAASAAPERPETRRLCRNPPRARPWRPPRWRRRRGSVRLQGCGGSRRPEEARPPLGPGPVRRAPAGRSGRPGSRRSAAACARPPRGGSQETRTTSSGCRADDAELRVDGDEDTGDIPLFVLTGSESEPGVEIGLPARELCPVMLAERLDHKAQGGLSQNLSMPPERSHQLCRRLRWIHHGFKESIPVRADEHHALMLGENLTSPLIG